MTKSRQDPTAASIEGLSLHPRIRRRVERYRQFYASNRPGDLLIVIRPRYSYLFMYRPSEGCRSGGRCQICLEYSR